MEYSLWLERNVPGMGPMKSQLTFGKKLSSNSEPGRRNI
jgi:hypothetical protein